MATDTQIIGGKNNVEQSLLLKKISNIFKFTPNKESITVPKSFMSKCLQSGCGGLFEVVENGETRNAFMACTFPFRNFDDAPKINEYALADYEGRGGFTTNRIFAGMFLTDYKKDFWQIIYQYFLRDLEDYRSKIRQATKLLVTPLGAFAKKGSKINFRILNDVLFGDKMNATFDEGFAETLENIKAIDVKFDAENFQKLVNNYRALRAELYSIFGIPSEASEKMDKKANLLTTELKLDFIDLSLIPDIMIENITEFLERCKKETGDKVDIKAELRYDLILENTHDDRPKDGDDKRATDKPTGGDADVK